MEPFHPDIVACYLYVITRHGYPPPAGDTAVHLGEMKQLGFRTVELEGIRRDHLGEMYGMRERIAAEARELALEVPVFCAVLPGLSSPDDHEREENLGLFEKGCVIAAELKSVSILDNAPLPPWTFPGGIPVSRHFDEEALAGATIPERLEWGRYRDSLVETYRVACDIASSYGLTFQLHPCYGALVNSTDAYLLFAGEVGRDNLRFNLDTANQFFMKDNLYLSLLRLKGHVDYIHLSDNRGLHVEHLPAGSGRIDWDRFFEALERTGYSGRFGIDVGGAESGVDNLDDAYRSTAEWLTQKWFNRK